MRLSKWAQAVKDRDGWECRDCGATDNLHAHHIKPLAMGGRNTLGNGITLCEKHHRERHTGAMSTVAMSRTSGVPKQDVAYILGVAAATIVNWQNSGVLPRHITYEDILRQIESKQVDTDAIRARLDLVRGL